MAHLLLVSSTLHPLMLTVATLPGMRLQQLSLEDSGGHRGVTRSLVGFWSRTLWLHVEAAHDVTSELLLRPETQKSEDRMYLLRDSPERHAGDPQIAYLLSSNPSIGLAIRI